MKIVRVWSVPSPNHGIARRLASFASYALGSTTTALAGGPCDLVIASVPNPLTDLAGVVIGNVRGVPVLQELRDLFPDNLLATRLRVGRVGWRAIKSYYQWVFRRVDLIAVPCRGIAEALQLRGVPSERILLLPHADDPERLDAGQGQTIRGRLGLDGAFVALYAGSFSSQYAVSQFLPAAEHLRDRLPRLRLVLVGTGPDFPTVQQTIRDQGLHNVVLVGAVPPDEVCHYLQAADLFLASHGLTSLAYGGCLHTKVCEYLMVGRAVVAVEPSPVLAPVLARIDAGCTIPPGKPRKLADAIAYFAEHPERAAECALNARRYARANLVRQSVVQAFEADLRSRLATLPARGRRAPVQI